MIALLPVHRHVRIAGLDEGIARKLVIGALDLLQHQHVRLILGQEVQHHGQAQAHRIDVPGDDGMGHGGVRIGRGAAGRGFLSPTGLDG
ncbi:hypothetical protein D3C72_1927130 [compost metagenome]